MPRINPEDVGKPVDYSFRNIKSLKPVDLESARETRIGEIPKRSKIGQCKYLTIAVLVNNNRLKQIGNLEEFVNNLIENPNKLSWLDFSFNYIVEIDSAILKYKKLCIVYFHGNKINKFEEIAKLRHLSNLRTVTFHGNPVASQKNYRNIIITLLPRILNLDFTPITRQEKNCPGAAEAIHILKSLSSKEKTQKNN